MSPNNSDSNMHPDAQNNKKVHVCKIDDCGEAFKRKEHLTRHQKSLKHNKDPIWFYCHWSLKSGGLCEHRVPNSASNLLEHIEVQHLNCHFHCRACEAVIGRYTSIGVHYSTCKAIQRQVAAGDERHYCKFFREESRPDSANMPAIEPEGWVYKTHVERISAKEASEARNRALRALGRRTMEKRRAHRQATTTTSEPVAGPSRLQASPAHTGGTSVPSTTHFNEVNQSNRQSYQTPWATPSSTTEPILAGPTHSGFQLPIPATPSIPLGDVVANGYQQPSFPAFPPQPSTTLCRREYVRCRHHPYRRDFADTSDDLPSSHHIPPMPEFEQGSSTGRSRSNTNSVPSPPSPWQTSPAYPAYRALEDSGYVYRARMSHIRSLCPEEPQLEDEDDE